VTHHPILTNQFFHQFSAAQAKGAQRWFELGFGIKE
jgi:hypothetical protein